MPDNAVMDNTFGTAALWSYGLAAAGFVAFVIRLAMGFRATARGSLMLAAVLISAIWASTGLLVASWPSVATWQSYVTLDTARYALWFAFLWSLLRGEETSKVATATSRPLPIWFAAILIAGLVASIIAGEATPFAAALEFHAYDWAYGARLGLAIAGLLMVEQLLRRAPADARWAVRPLGVALAGLFAFDLYFYADALLFGRMDEAIWTVRGLANALLIPFFAAATARNPRWSIEMHMSRQVVFHSTALLVSAAFLLVVAAAGALVRYMGGSWGKSVQIVLLFAALLVVVFVASSGGFRAKLRVLVSKHFFSYRYDYRKEWLRFTQALSAEMTLQGVQERTIMALADLVESPGGVLWLPEGDIFRPVSRCNTPAIDAIERSDGELVSFLARTTWIVDLKELATTPSRYSGLDLPDWLRTMPSAWLVVPLISHAELAGFVVLLNPRTAFDVNWEVLDVLKTAGRQAASFMGYVRATESLLEARKFDAFNRMSAFVVHDLKNLVAQLSLMLKNAERHRENPEFQRDMLATVEHVVGRMYHLMSQLRTGCEPPDKPAVTDIAAVVRRACEAKGLARAAVELEAAQVPATLAHEDRLDRVIGHLVQNALDATSGGGSVTVRLRTEGSSVVLEVVDTGIGMSPEFVRDRLFKAFETTKPGGMGIGVYESAQYVAALGGRIEVDSTPGAGTRVRLSLPALGHAPARQASPRAVA